MAIKLLMLADDFSGALDAGVKFSSMGVDTLVLADRKYVFEDIHAEVLVVNTSSRHLPAKEAKNIIYNIVRAAVKAGIPYIFKKTDSVLRGNIGAELSGALDAFYTDALIFFPAFPETHRTTKNGIQYYEGIPIHQSCLSGDPFDPIYTSNIADIIHTQADTPVVSLPAHQTWGAIKSKEKVIVVYDSETNRDMEIAVYHLFKQDRLHLVAGCAGLASILLPFLPLKCKKVVHPNLKKIMLFICGSINPVTRKQITYAEKNGFMKVELTLAQQLDKNFPKSEDFKKVTEQLWTAGQEKRPLILSSSPDLNISHVAPALLEHTKTLEQRRMQISSNLSAVLKELLDRGLDYSIMISGGDVLLEVMQQIGCEQLKPMGELAPGTVLSNFFYNNHEYQLVSKSGGFGTETLLVDMLKQYSVV